MTDNNSPIEPPKLGQYLLRKIYDDVLYDEVSGDLREIFMDRLSTHGHFLASCHYMKDALLSARNFDLSRQKKITHNNTIAMLGNYIKITVRTISKNKVYSSLNIFGLALGIAACLFIVQYVSYEKSYDKFHVNHENLYRVMYKVYRNGELDIDCAAAVPRVGPFMKEKMPEVVDYARAFPISGVISYEGKKYREKRIQIVDPSFISIFSFPLLEGDPATALTEPNSVVISETAARKYFGDQEAMGKVIKANGHLELTLAVTGVAKDVPANSHIKFDFLISYETLNSATRNEEGTSDSETAWGWYDFNTYVLLQEGTTTADFDSRFAEYLYDERGEDFEKYNSKQEFPLQPITDIHLYSNLLQESEPDEQGDGDAVFFLSIIAVFILVIAWINYINLATARSVERAKEVGVRKTMGAHRGQLIYQFLSEAFVLNFIALLLGLLVVIVGIRFFNQLADSQLSLTFLSDPKFWMGTVVLFVIGSTISGLYPAFVLSSFRPVSVLKGKLSASNSGKYMRKGLVVFQFAASITLIAGTMIVYQQLAHMRNADLGFDMNDTLVLKGPSVFGEDSLFASTHKAFITELLKNPEIKQVSASSNVPGDEIFWANGIKRDEANDDAVKITHIAGVDYEYFSTYKIEILAGRNYSPTFQGDSASVILNKAGIESLGFLSPEEAIGKKVTFWGHPKTIVGVVADYNQMSVKTNVSPIVFPLITDANDYFSIKLQTSNYGSTLEYAQQHFDQFFPGNPFDYFFLDSFFNRQYNNEQTFSRVFTLFAGFAIIVACLGLFGLSSFSALQRTKEIGIRKAIGANLNSIIILLSKEYALLIALANVVAWPAIYLVMESWLNNFPTRINIGFYIFFVSGILVVLIAVLTVGYKTLMTARSNPVDALRDE